MGVRAVFLVGFMGSGKNTVGRELARRLHWNFVDLDARIEAREGQTVPDIFRLQGEPAFRLAETNTLRDLIAQSLEQDSVVALGGGAFVQATNRELLHQWPTVFLEAPADELWRRCQQDGVERPLGKDRSQFARLYAQRLPHYRQASLVINTAGRQVAAICQEIEHALELRETREDAASKSTHVSTRDRAMDKSSSDEL